MNWFYVFSKKNVEITYEESFNYRNNRGRVEKTPTQLSYHSS